MNALFYISVLVELNFYNDSINECLFDNFEIYVQAFKFVLNLSIRNSSSDSDLHMELINFGTFT